MHNKVSNAMDTAVLMMSPYAKVQYDGVSSTMTGELTVDGVQVRLVGFRDELYIDSIGIDTPSFLSLLELSDLISARSDGMPDYIGFIVEGLRIPVDADYYEDLYEFMLEARGAKDADAAAAACVGKYGFSPVALSALGYDDQVMSMSMFIRDDETRYSMEMTMGLEDMWDMDVNVSLSGNLKAEMMKGPMFRPRLSDMRVEFTDRSLNGRVVKYCGELGLSPQETFAAQLDSLKFVGEENGIEFDEYLIEPFKEFIKGKQTLVITARPNEPVAFSQIDLYKPSDVPALLNLAAVAR
jgi:hypothetical protein